MIHIILGVIQEIILIEYSWTLKQITTLKFNNYVTTTVTIINKLDHSNLELTTKRQAKVINNCLHLNTFNIKVS